MQGLGPRLIWCAPAVFVAGIAALVASWSLFFAYYPEGFVGTLPTISETISRAPASYAFQLMMCVVTPSIVVTWLINFDATRTHLTALAGQGVPVLAMERLNLIACILGIVAGLFLAGLSAFQLHNGHMSHRLHIWLSEGFYATQILAFICDTLCARLRNSHSSSPVQARSLRARASVTLITGTLSLIFLFLYLERGLFADPYLAQALYVACEYVLAGLCFAYPLAAFAEMRSHVGSVRSAVPA